MLHISTFVPQAVPCLVKNLSILTFYEVEVFYMNILQHNTKYTLKLRFTDEQIYFSLILNHSINGHILLTTITPISSKQTKYNYMTFIAISGLNIGI